MFVTHVNGRYVEAYAKCGVETDLIKNIIQYYGTWYGSDRGGFAAMFVNPTYLHIYDNEFDDEKADEIHSKKPWGC
jgi:hypothetical protein